MYYKVIERSLIAYAIRKFNGWKTVAVTFGSHIYLSGASKRQFKKNKRWVAHELVHVHQYKTHGFFTFALLYLLDFIRNGYKKNKFEVEARERTGEFLKFVK